MKLQDIKEMAIRGGNLRPMANNFAVNFINGYFKKNKNSFKHIGDIEEYKLLQHDTFLIAIDKEVVIFICNIEKCTYRKSTLEVDNIWVDEKYSKQKLFAKILWFLRSREGHQTIIFGNVHSDDTYDILKNGGLSKFKKSWHNTSTDENQPFDVETIDKYYNGAKWKLVLETTEEADALVEEVKNCKYSFYTDIKSGWIKSSYDWQIV